MAIFLSEKFCIKIFFLIIQKKPKNKNEIYTSKRSANADLQRNEYYRVCNVAKIVFAEEESKSPSITAIHFANREKARGTTS